MKATLVAVGALIASSPRIASATDHGHHVAVTNSPLHMLSPGIVEMTGEYALGRKLGIAAVGGYGQTKFESTDGAGNVVDEHPVTIYEAGGSGRYYVLGSFDHGMQLGGEAMYLHVDDRDRNDGMDAQASGVSFGPFIGYKKTAKFGLTFDAQLGYQWFLVQAKAEDDAGNTGEASGRGEGLLLNLNLGWAF